LAGVEVVVSLSSVRREQPLVPGLVHRGLIHLRPTPLPQILGVVFHILEEPDGLREHVLDVLVELLLPLQLGILALIQVLNHILQRPQLVSEVLLVHLVFHVELLVLEVVVLGGEDLRRVHEVPALVEVAPRARHLWTPPPRPRPVVILLPHLSTLLIVGDALLEGAQHLLVPAVEVLLGFRPLDLLHHLHQLGLVLPNIDLLEIELVFYVDELLLCLLDLPPEALQLTGKLLRLLLTQLLLLLLPDLRLPFPHLHLLLMLLELEFEVAHGLGDLGLGIVPEADGFIPDLRGEAVLAGQAIHLILLRRQDLQLFLLGEVYVLQDFFEDALESPPSLFIPCLELGDGVGRHRTLLKIEVLTLKLALLQLNRILHVIFQLLFLFDEVLDDFSLRGHLLAPP